MQVCVVLRTLDNCVDIRNMHAFCYDDVVRYIFELVVLPRLINQSKHLYTAVCCKRIAIA